MNKHQSQRESEQNARAGGSENQTKPDKKIQDHNKNPQQSDKENPKEVPEYSPLDMDESTGGSAMEKPESDTPDNKKDGNN